ncbi:MAG: carbohydrate porin [Gammaproteobacteria bacterium]|nr:carbohydrate porin [Gammaproteobacteria bacterium]
MFKKSLAVSFAVAAAVGALGTKAALADVPLPSVGGKIFTDLTNIKQQNNGTDTSTSGTGVDVKRFYLIVNEKFDDMWSAKLETDATYNSGQQVDVYMKNAWLQMTLDQAFWVRLGESDMPWIPFDEGIYNHRYVENTLIDRLHFGNSADWGLHIGGDLLGKTLSYQISAVNGAGYKNPTRSKDMDLEGRVSWQPIGGLTLAVGGYEGKLGQDKYANTVTVAGAPVQQTYRTASRVDVLAAYVANGLRVGVEYFSANDWTNGVTGANDVPELTSAGKPNASDKADGTSVFASYDFTPMWGVFGRWDQAKLSKDLASGLKDQYFNVGLESHPIKNVDVAFVYKHEKMDGGPATGSFSTTNGSAFNEADGKYDEVGIWAQVSF